MFFFYNFFSSSSLSLFYQPKLPLKPFQQFVCKIITACLFLFFFVCVTKDIGKEQAIKVKNNYNIEIFREICSYFQHFVYTSP